MEKIQNRAINSFGQNKISFIEEIIACKFHFA